MRKGAILERAFLVEVRRSSKRRKTIEAYRKGDTIIVVSTDSADLCTDIGLVTHRGKNSEIH